MADPANQLATLAQNIQKGIRNRLLDLHTSMPGEIVKFDASTQLAEVKPMIKRLFAVDTGEEEQITEENLPLLINVPVIFPRGGGFSLTFPVKPGDECLLVFTERSFGPWHEFGEARKPDANRMHDLSDAVCFVGLSSTPNKVPNYDANKCQLKSDNGQVVISLNPDNTLTVSASSGMTFNGGPSMNFTADDINFDSTTLTHNATNIGDDHVHPQDDDSGGNSEQDTGGPQ